MNTDMFDADTELEPMKHPSRTWEAIFAEVPEAPSPDLPELVGTEKQIAWAKKIRKEKLAEVEALLRQSRLLLERLEAKGDETTACRQVHRAQLDVLALLQAQAAARYWIERRSFEAADLLAWRTPEADSGKVAK